MFDLHINLLILARVLKRDNLSFTYSNKFSSKGGCRKVVNGPQFETPFSFLSFLVLSFSSNDLWSIL